MESSANIPQINITNYAEGTPQLALAEYLSAWCNCRWEAMFNKTQTTWKNDNSLTKLKQLIGGQQPLGAVIGEEQNISGLKNSVVRDIGVTLFLKSPFYKKWVKKKTFIKQIVVRLIKETAPYVADETGTWGVNPISALRQENGDRRA